MRLRYRTELYKWRRKLLHVPGDMLILGFLAVFCLFLSSPVRVFADSVPRMSDRRFDAALIEMTGEHNRKVTPGQAKRNPYIMKRLIVKSDDPCLDPEEYGAVDAIQNTDGTYVLQFDSSIDARKAQVKLQKKTATEYAEPDYVLFSTEGEEEYTDTAAGNLQAASDSSVSWNVAMMGLDRYASLILSENYSKEVTVAVLDVGISYKNPQIRNRLLTSKAKSYVSGYSANEDESGYYNSHATHIAGIIAQCTPGLDVKILPVRILDSKDQSGSVTKMISGINYAVEQGADVINLSLAGAAGCTVESAEKCIQDAVNSGVVVVVSSGNTSPSGADINAKYIVPAYIPDCVVVGSADSEKVRASTSNYGDTLDVVAPGVKIVSCGYRSDGGYSTSVSMSGTSMAAPHVSAEAAVLSMVNSSYAKEEKAKAIEKLIQQSALDRGSAGKDKYYGYGLATLSTVLRTVTFAPGVHGTFPVTSKQALYGAATPSAPSVTGDSDNVFAGWSPELSSVVTEDVTYTAQWKVNSFTITWKNEDGTVLETDQNVKAGETPAYNGQIPTKAPTETYTYSFSGWDPTVQAVTGDAVYTAAYTAVLQESITNVINLINTIGTVEYTEESRQIISAARTAYNVLSSSQQALVTNAAVLVQAESQYASLKESAERKTTEQTTTEQTNSGSSTKESVTISKRPTSVKAKVRKNKVTVSWKKIRKTSKTKALRAQIKAIEIQYSTDPSFEANVISKYVGAKKTKVRLKLQKGTTWYIRVRYVGDTGVSKWSKVKRARIK